jgi:hypothetical protein
MKRRVAFFSFCFLVFCSLVACVDDVRERYFTQEFLREAINDPNLREVVSASGIIFDTAKAEGLRVYGGVAPFETLFSEDRLLTHFIAYMNYNVILLTESVDGFNFVRDFIILEKQHPETHLADGAVEINGEYFNWEIIVVINRHWEGAYTEDIDKAFIIDVPTRRIEPFQFERIRLFGGV